MKACFFLLILTAKVLTAEISPQENSCVCGNGVQETLPLSIAPCPYRLYGATTLGPTSISNLIYLNPYDGTGNVVAPISGPIRAVTGLDFSPTGVLYAVGRNLSNQAVLATVNCETGLASIVGLTNSPGTGVTGINFDSQGRLWAHTTGVTSGGVRQDGLLGMINIATGQWSLVGNTFINDIGNGIAFGDFPNNTLYHAGYINLSILDQMTGEASSVSPLMFSDPAVNRPRINDMDFDPLHNIMYAAINDKPSGQSSLNINYLGRINLNTGEVSFSKLPAELAPEGLSAVTFNRPYETCDQGGVPENNPPPPNGTACTEACALTESTCTDGLDNDANGLTDCLDTACDGLTCIASDGCTEDFCANSTCEVGPLKNCNDFVDCTTDTCNLGLCVNQLIVSNPCNDFNSCTTNDSCNEAGECLAEPLPDGSSCDDESPCTINDRCFDSQCRGERAPEICDNGIDDNCDELVDGDDPECAGAVTIEDICDDSEDNDGDFLIDCDDPDCEGLNCVDDGEPCTDDICQFFSCTPMPNDTNVCDDFVECTDDSCNGGVCVGTNDNSNVCDDNNLCTENDACIAGICVGTAIACDDDNECTTDFCLAGECSIAPLTGTSCTADDKPCTDDVCNNGECTHVNDNTNTCSDDLACTTGDACSAGVCSGIAGTETTTARCTNGVDDDCDFLIDSLDPNCASTLWLRVFITSTTYKPTWGNVTNADALCQARAVAASRTGTFKAFVSSSTSNAAIRITNPNNKPWYMYSNAPNRIANNKADLLDGTVQQAINVTEFGIDVGTKPKFSWTGSNTDGTSNGVTCNNWSTGVAKVKGTRGASDKIDEKWVNQPDATCNQEYRLYCFQVE